MFHAERGVLLFHGPPRSREPAFLCWPVLVYRVTAPVLRLHHLNIFEKVILALCRAGVRQPDDIARRIHQNAELCGYVIRQLKNAGRLDPSGAPTQEGLRTLATGTVSEDTEVVVTHVFQDAARPSGELWPRTAAELSFQPVRRVRGTDVDLRLNSAGRPRKETAHLIAPCDQARTASLPSPRADQIIYAVAAHHTALAQHRVDQFAQVDRPTPAAFEAEQELSALHTEFAMPPEEQVNRVWDVRPPTAEYLLTWLEPDAETAEGTSGWRAPDPFGLDPGLMHQQLVLSHMQSDPRLAKAVASLTSAVDDRLNHRYRKVAHEVRDRSEGRLVEQLGDRIRGYPSMLDLLFGLEDAAARMASGADVEAVARETIRAYEHLFRRLVDEYRPMPPGWQAQTGKASDIIVREQLSECAARIGFSRLPPLITGDFVIKPFARDLAATRSDPPKFAKRMSTLISKGSIKELVPWALIAAADSGNPENARHPLRGLAGRRPHLFTELGRVNDLRNRGSHGDRDASTADDAEWCRELAVDAAKTVLELTPEPERTTAQ
ncbi:hypothetical protein [Streptomyces hygroscopicus]|uniref:hypothetical protein n=1 Tax=Streptomyces hygroscopicus TaxID=1912 RepID=UPI000780DA31|nr:hypothetical protein [Streptomyces hygroscopicus]